MVLHNNYVYLILKISYLRLVKRITVFVPFLTTKTIGIARNAKLFVGANKTDPPANRLAID